MEIERNTANHLKNLQPPAGNGGDDLNPPPLPLKCPRCNSYNTKFCYYNNYSKAQPRYYCRACRRHWTHGGKQWNVPIGGKRRNMIPRILPAAEAPEGHMAMAQLPEIPSPLPPPSMIVNTSYVGGIFSHPYPPNQFCENLSLLQAMTFQSSRSTTSGNLFPTHQNLNNQPIGTWAPNMNTTGPSFAGEGPSFLDEAGPYFDVNQWENDEHQG